MVVDVFAICTFSILLVAQKMANDMGFKQMEVVSINVIIPLLCLFSLEGFDDFSFFVCLGL